MACTSGKLKIHPLTLDDITKPRREPSQGAHFPKVEEFPDYLFIIVNPLLSLLDDGSAEPDPKAKPWNRTHRQLSAVVFLNVLVTHHYDPLSSVDALREWLARHPRTMERGPDYMLHLILDAMVDEYAPLIDRIAEHLDRLETRVYRDPADTLMRRMIRMKRLIVSLRKTLILEREVLARLSRGEFEFVEMTEVGIPVPMKAPVPVWFGAVPAVALSWTSWMASALWVSQIRVGSLGSRASEGWLPAVKPVIVYSVTSGKVRPPSLVVNL